MIFLHHQTRRSLHCCRILEFFRKSASFTAWIGHSSAGRQSCHFWRACIAFMLNFTSEAFVLMLSPKLPLTLISIIHKTFLAICHWWVIFTKQDTWQYIPKMMLIWTVTKLVLASCKKAQPPHEWKEGKCNAVLQWGRILGENADACLSMMRIFIPRWSDMTHTNCSPGMGFATALSTRL